MIKDTMKMTPKITAIPRSVIPSMDVFEGINKATKEALKVTKLSSFYIQQNF